MRGTWATSAGASGKKIVAATIDIDDKKDPRRQFLGKSTGPFDGIWSGTAVRDSGNCRVKIVGSVGSVSLQSFNLELVVRGQDITGRVKKIRNRYFARYSINVSFRGTVRENGEIDLQAGETDLGAEFVLRGKLPEEGSRANGEWDTPGCQGKFSLTRKYPY